jgi:phosphomevalonate kinase
LSIKVNVPGKLIIVGEYAVLEGADALVAAITRYVNAEISASENKYCRLSGNLTTESITFLVDDLGEVVPTPGQSDQLLTTMNFAISIISHICKKIKVLGIDISPFNLQIDTSQFYLKENKLGLGSSAALTVALIVILSFFTGIEKRILSSKFDLFRFACETHFRAQGNQGSGIDIAASVNGGINIYNVNWIVDEGGDPIKTSIPVIEDLFILPVWTGVSASTREFLVQVDKYKVEFESEYIDTMSRLVALSESGCLAYKDKNCLDLLDIIKDYYKVLYDFSCNSKIPIISKIHQRIAEVVHSYGGIYKPSGAGGGDIGLAFSNSKEVLNKISNDLLKNNVKTLSLGISKEGFIVQT